MSAAHLDAVTEDVIGRLRSAREHPDFGRVTPHSPTERARAIAADHVNIVFRESATPAACAKNLIRMVAELEHAEYPQYANHWDDWEVGVMLEGVETRMGTACLKGDVVLWTQKDGREHTTFYSIQNAVDTACFAGQIRPADPF